jgi:hypothetical protein
LAVITGREEQYGDPDPRTYEVKVRRTWHLRTLKTWPPGTSVIQVADEIRETHAVYPINDERRLKDISIDCWGDSEIVRDLRKLLRGRGLDWRPTPVVEGERSDQAVRRSDLLYRWQSGVQQKILLVDPSFGADWQEHALKLDHGVRWRESDNDYLICAIGLAYWRTEEGAAGYMPGRLL